jgi:hypothetical protein
MIVVRNSFVAKPGQAGKLAAHFKEMAALAEMKTWRVLTDVTGEFNTVVFEHEVESLSALEELLKKYMSDPKVKEKAKEYLEMWETGSRQILRVM